MGNLAFNLVIKDYDHVAPLAMGDVVAEDLDLTLDRDTPGALDRTRDDPSVHAGEMSFSRYLIGLSQGDRTYVGLPIFPVRGFKYRSFFVKRGSPLRNLADLKGKRMGTNEWLATGNTWGRAAMRERGVRTQDVEWWVGSVDGKRFDPVDDLPPHAHRLEPGRTLCELLISGEIDAMTVPLQPPGFYEPDSEIVRMIPNYAEAELAYYERTGLYPASHIIVMRREVFEQNPWIARSIFNALNASKARADAARKHFNEASPWMLPDIERAWALMGRDWRPYGVEPNRVMIAALCEEEYEQGLIPNRLDPNTVFAEFEQVMAG